MSSLPLQAFVGVQDTVSLPVPAHCFPSYAGAGFEQDRVRVLVPVTVPDVGWQVTEHAPYDPQLAQFPSTESKLFHCIKLCFFISCTANMSHSIHTPVWQKLEAAFNQ